VGVLKLLAAKGDGKILGVHCIGPHASELIHLGHAVMALGGDLHYFAEAVFNYPTLGEAYKYAAFEALDRMKGGAPTA
jgi:NAD(P) transhydrogenase